MWPDHCPHLARPPLSAHAKIAKYGLNASQGSEKKLPKCTWAVYSASLSYVSRINTKERNAEKEVILASGEKSLWQWESKIRYQILKES